jgi:hypothetical protein
MSGTFKIPNLSIIFVVLNSLDDIYVQLNQINFNIVIIDNL